MTAFARQSASPREGGWTVEIRSLNHRHFEFSLKISPALATLESRIREAVQEKIKRGKITIAVGQDGASESGRQPVFDEDAVAHYVKELRKMKKKFRLSGDVAVSDVLRLPGIFAAEKTGLDPDKEWPGIRKVLSKAIAQALEAKETEGAKLYKDADARLQAIRRSMQGIEKHAAGQAERFFRRISEKARQILEGASIEPERVEREAALLAERSDITEELVRMKSHLDLFGQRLKVEGEIGRELDFLCQEMNREVNTMASKSQHFEIATEVVFIKGEIEKIREQIQNIE